MKNEFYKFATGHLGMNGLALEQYGQKVTDYISPTVIEERQLNAVNMDVFSRLMMDRIIFLGDQIDDYVANVIQAQLLFLESADPKRDIQIYVNSPGGSVYAGLGIYDTMQFVSPDVATICTGLAASMAAVLLRRRKRQTLRTETLAHNDSSAYGRRSGTGNRHRDNGTRDSGLEERTLRNHRRTQRTTFR